ncbi:MAG: hypothetical protein IBX57_00550 [Gammaproteobacteria bacterium]|nr:hypothetical protein [Gammaproteobacteria bacterium]
MSEDNKTSRYPIEQKLFMVVNRKTGLCYVTNSEEVAYEVRKSADTNYSDGEGRQAILAHKFDELLETSDRWMNNSMMEVDGSVLLPDIYLPGDEDNLFECILETKVKHVSSKL